jgi:ankyrin repeat protein
MQIHTYAKQGNIQGVGEEIAKGVEIDCVDQNKPRTPLMYAVASKKADIDMIRFLIENGADLNAAEGEFQETVLGLAIKSGNLAKIQFLLDSGADINYQRPHGYDALIDAMHGRDISQDQDLIAILRVLLQKGAKVDGISSYQETALKVASRVGRFDAVQLLLKAGCDRQQLKWTPLMYSIVFGSFKDVKNSLEQGADLNVRDGWSRTPWLLSIQVGDLDKAMLILDSGANRQDRGIGGQSSLIYAIENNHVAVLNWLIAEGFDLEAADDSNTTPLIAAAETGATDCVRILLAAGANPGKVNDFNQKAINSASNMSIVRMLVEAGENLSEINGEMRRTLTGVTDRELQVSQKQYLAGKYRRFGTSNPEIMEIDFWRGMVRCGLSAWSAKVAFGDIDSQDKPVWCYDRFGRTITALPDGRIVEIAGEHEDYYDPDFCIYNDIVIYENDGSFQILSYPQDIFPPTDFHSATLIGKYIYIIGNLGYTNSRISEETPVYKLNWQSFRMARVDTTGNKPGWINRHQAFYHEPSNTIHISGGFIWQEIDEQTDKYGENHLNYVLDLTTLEWSQIDIRP